MARTAKQGISGDIVDAAGRSPVARQAARSQIGFSDRRLEGGSLKLLLELSKELLQIGQFAGQGLNL
jgi:hypothetical protein